MGLNMRTLAQEIAEKKRLLYVQVSARMMSMANSCIHYIKKEDELDYYLKQGISRLDHCSMLYVTDCNYRQISSNVTNENIINKFRGQNLSSRPYLQSTVPLKGMVSSDIYQDERSSKTCITLVHAIYSKQGLEGFLFADFNLNDLPVDSAARKMFDQWQQFKGDPAIRGGLFQQHRNNSLLDLNIDKVHELSELLLLDNGVFHIKLHYSSSRLSLWLYDKPHHYQVHSINELLDGTVFSCYQKQKYPDDACVTEEQIHKVFSQYKQLRYADENVYLRSASLNIVNAMVGLNFSCDGSYYIPVKAFIDNSFEYWVGKSETN